MTAEERYEWAWKRYLVRLNENSKIRLTSFLREIHVYQRGMERWMYARGLSVGETKRQIRESQNRAKYERLLPSSDTIGSMFLVSVSAMLVYIKIFNVFYVMAISSPRRTY